MSAESELPPTARKNVETIAEVERQLLGQRTQTERFSDRIAAFFGSLTFTLPMWCSSSDGVC